MDCFTCVKRTNSYKVDKVICGSCREVLKIDIVQLLLQLDPVYLSENNRNKSGRPPKLTLTEQYDIRQEYKNGKSMMNLSKEYKVCKTTISNVVHKNI